MAKHTELNSDHYAKFVGAHVHNSAAQSIGTGAFTTVTFDTERFDTDSIHSTSSNTGRLTVPAGMTGKWAIWAGVGFAPNTTGDRGARFFKNGTTRIAETMSRAGASQDIRLTLFTVVDLTAADYVEVQVFQDSGGNLNTSRVADGEPQFGMYRLQ